MSDEKQENNQSKSPLDSAINQIKEATLKDVKSQVKTAAEEYAKASIAKANAKQKVLDAIQAVKDKEAEFAEIKNELKDAN